MIISKPNENGVLNPGDTELVARHGRAYASVEVALGEDGLYRAGIDMRYSHGGFSSPISIHGPGYATREAACAAGLEELLRRWHHPFPSDPRSVHDELALMRQQIEARRQQPTLF